MTATNSERNHHGSLRHLEQQGGVGKSYLTFQIASEYARTHRDQKVLVIDMCPQANSSGMLLGGIVAGEQQIEAHAGMTPPRTISGYVADRVVSPYVDPHTGANYIMNVHGINRSVPDNLFLV